MKGTEVALRQQELLISRLLSRAGRDRQQAMDKTHAIRMSGRKDSRMRNSMTGRVQAV